MAKHKQPHSTRNARKILQYWRMAQHDRPRPKRQERPAEPEKPTAQEQPPGKENYERDY